MQREVVLLKASLWRERGQRGGGDPGSYSPFLGQPDPAAQGWCPQPAPVSPRQGFPPRFYPRLRSAADIPFRILHGPVTFSFGLNL